MTGLKVINVKNYCSNYESFKLKVKKNAFENVDKLLSSGGLG